MLSPQPSIHTPSFAFELKLLYCVAFGPAEPQQWQCCSGMSTAETHKIEAMPRVMIAVEWYVEVTKQEC